MSTRKSSKLTGNRQAQGLGHQTRVTEGGDGDSRQVRRTGGGALRPVVVEVTGWSEFSNNGGAGGLHRDNKKNEGLWS